MLYDFYFNSPDGGQTWGSWQKMGDVELINNLYGWKMTSQNGSLSQIEKTQDGGLTWEKIKTVQWQGDLEFVTPHVGWAIAKQGEAVALVSTNDGGRTWREIKPIIQASTSLSGSTELSEPTTAPTALKFEEGYIQMISEMIGWGTAMLPDSQHKNWTRRILRTIDRGRNWWVISPKDWPEIMDISFLDDKNAWVLTANTATQSENSTMLVWRTRDGGQTWNKGEPIAERGFGGQLTFVDTQHGWLLMGNDIAAGSESVTLYKTENGGINWEETLSTSLANEPSLDSIPLGCHKDYLGFRDVSTGWVTGDCFSDEVLFEVTSDGGLSWRHQELPQSDDFIHTTCIPYPPTFFSPWEGILQVICPTTDLLIYHTYDGGQTWDIPDHRGKLFDTSLVDFIDINNGWYVALEDSPTNLKGKAFYVTHDGGKTSNEIIPIISISDAHYDAHDIFIDSPAEALGNLNFIDQKTGFALTDPISLDYSLILKTTDGGYTWIVWAPHLLPAKP
jgi:photosystem II stability/assembly factor-like uncharacterized protein